MKNYSLLLEIVLVVFLVVDLSLKGGLGKWEK